jgi:hypothetical protein
MEESEKELLELLKNFDKTKLFKKQSYVEILINDKFVLAFIANEVNNQKLDLYIPNCYFKADVSTLNFFGENDYSEDIKIRKSPINFELNRLEVSEIINNIKKELNNFNITLNSKPNISLSSDKTNNNRTGLSFSLENNLNIDEKENEIPDKKGKLINVTGYLLYQFLEGYILDSLSVFTEALERKVWEKDHLILFSLILDIIIYMGRIVKENINKYKVAYYNRKFMIVNPIYAILISYDSLIINLTPKYGYNYNSHDYLDRKLSEIANSVYQIILESKKKN